MGFRAQYVLNNFENVTKSMGFEHTYGETTTFAGCGHTPWKKATGPGQPWCDAVQPWRVHRAYHNPALLFLQVLNTIEV